MEIEESEKYELAPGPKIENDTKDFDEIIIFYYFGWCCIIVCIICTVIFIFFPCIIYCNLIRPAYKAVIAVDKKKKLLIIGNRGIIKCCCIFDQKYYFLNSIKNIKIEITYRDDPNIGFGKLYYINGYIYSYDDNCEALFKDINYTKEKYDYFVSFYKKYFNNIEEPLENAKKDNNVPVSNSMIIPVFPRTPNFTPNFRFK